MNKQTLGFLEEGGAQNGQNQGIVRALFAWRVRLLWGALLLLMFSFAFPFALYDNFLIATLAFLLLSTIPLFLVGHYRTMLTNRGGMVGLFTLTGVLLFVFSLLESSTIDGWLSEILIGEIYLSLWLLIIALVGTSTLMLWQGETFLPLVALAWITLEVTFIFVGYRYGLSNVVNLPVMEQMGVAVPLIWSTCLISIAGPCFILKLGWYLFCEFRARG